MRRRGRRRRRARRRGRRRRSRRRNIVNYPMPFLKPAELEEPARTLAQIEMLILRPRATKSKLPGEGARTLHF